jgi:hypothetical protein
MQDPAPPADRGGGAASTLQFRSDLHTKLILQDEMRLHLCSLEASELQFRSDLHTKLNLTSSYLN